MSAVICVTAIPYSSRYNVWPRSCVAELPRPLCCCLIVLLGGGIAGGTQENRRARLPVRSTQSSSSKRSKQQQPLPETAHSVVRLVSVNCH